VNVRELIAALTCAYRGGCRPGRRLRHNDMMMSRADKVFIKPIDVMAFQQYVTNLITAQRPN